MALDYENGRPMQIEAILGNTVRAARKHGAATPILDALYALAKMVEAKRLAVSRDDSAARFTAQISAHAESERHDPPN